MKNKFMKKNILYLFLAFLILSSFIVFGAIGVYKTENGIVPGLPDYEKRDIRVSQFFNGYTIQCSSLPAKAAGLDRL